MLFVNAGADAIQLCDHWVQEDLVKQIQSKNTEVHPSPFMPTSHTSKKPFTQTRIKCPKRASSNM